MRDLLLEHMCYFQSYLCAERGHEEIDISVHCDVHIFEWLMEWIHQPDTPPAFDTASVISILISADFLQMVRLRVRLRLGVGVGLGLGLGTGRSGAPSARSLTLT